MLPTCLIVNTTVKYVTRAKPTTGMAYNMDMDLIKSIAVHTLLAVLIGTLVYTVCHVWLAIL